MDNITLNIGRKCREKSETNIVGAYFVLIRGNYAHCHKQLAKIFHQELVRKCRLSKRKPTAYHKYDRSRWPCGLRPSLRHLELSDREFEPRSGHECSSFVFVWCRVGRVT